MANCLPVPVLGRESVSPTDAVTIVKAIRGGPAEAAAVNMKRAAAMRMRG